jgi:4-amino-4-deoxy-L-arabinose transferase-like glycosyltransferase
VTAVAPRAPARSTDRLFFLGWVVIGCAIAARIGWAAWVAHAHPAAVESGDTVGYLGPARALLEHGRFSLSPQNDTPMFLRTPGYPLFLAAILWVTDSQWSISPIQAASTLITVLLVVMIGRKVISPAAGLLAGIFVAVDPLQFALSGTILTESLTSLLVVGIAGAAIPVFVRQPERVQARHVVALAVLIAAATLVRPTTFYFPAVVVVLLVVRFWRVPRRSLLALGLAFLVPTVVIVGAWNVHNHERVRSWQISGSQALTIYCWHAAEVEARVSGVGVKEARRRLECSPGGWDDLASGCPSWWACDARQPLADGPSWDEMNRRGVRILREHPTQTAVVMARGLVREVAGPGTDTVGRFLHVRSSKPLSAVLFLWNVFLWSLAAVGAVVGLRSFRRWYWGFLLSVVGYVLLVSAGANSGARFRTPLVPLLALFAAMGARYIVGAMRRARGGPARADREPQRAML